MTMQDRQRAKELGFSGYYLEYHDDDTFESGNHCTILSASTAKEVYAELQDVI